MTSEVSIALQRLGHIKSYDYFKNKGMPEFVEPLVTELIDLFANYSEIQQQKVMAEVSDEVSSVLGWYARKVAGRAVREDSRTDLRNGILALVIGGRCRDFRDGLSPLALLNHSALKLGEDPRALFEAASRTVHEQGNLFDIFLRRSPDLNTIQTFGFSEGMGPNGFDYIPLLPEFGGPTPF